MTGVHGTVDTAFVIDADVVQLWAELSGDFNQLHLDPEFAATTRYGRCIAHGPILASMVGEWVVATLADSAPAPLGIKYRFAGPVFVPSRVHATAALSSDEITIVCTDEADQTVLTATCARQVERP